MLSLTVAKLNEGLWDTECQGPQPGAETTNEDEGFHVVVCVVVSGAWFSEIHNIETKCSSCSGLQL